MEVKITPNCRKVQGGDTEAFEKAIEILKERYDVWVKMPLYKDKSFVVSLTVAHTS